MQQPHAVRWRLSPPKIRWLCPRGGLARDDHATRWAMEDDGDCNAAPFSPTAAVGDVVNPAGGWCSSPNMCWADFGQPGRITDKLMIDATTPVVLDNRGHITAAAAVVGGICRKKPGAEKRQRRLAARKVREQAFLMKTRQLMNRRAAILRCAIRGRSSNSASTFVGKIETDRCLWTESRGAADQPLNIIPKSAPVRQREKIDDVFCACR